MGHGCPVRMSALPAFALLAASLVGCASGRPAPAAPETVRPGWSETGEASWYGEPFHGLRTASGEVYDMEGMTAAHPWLPFGSVVRVENRDNRRTSVVRVNDRGPFKRGRIIDLSRAAARELRMIGRGTARVHVVVVELARPPSCLELQVGAFRDADNARAARRRLEAAGLGSREEPAEDGLRRVLAGPFQDLESVRRARDRFGGVVRTCPDGE